MVSRRRKELAEVEESPCEACWWPIPSLSPVRSESVPGQLWSPQKQASRPARPSHGRRPTNTRRRARLVRARQPKPTPWPFAPATDAAVEVRGPSLDRSGPQPSEAGRSGGRVVWSCESLSQRLNLTPSPWPPLFHPAPRKAEVMARGEVERRVTAAIAWTLQRSSEPASRPARGVGALSRRHRTPHPRR